MQGIGANVTDPLTRQLQGRYETFNSSCCGAGTVTVLLLELK